MNEEKLKELFSNEEFVKDLFESKSYEDAQAKLAAKDVDVSIEELKKIRELLRKKQSGELSDEELENIAGGYGFICAIVATSIVVVGGTAAGIAVEVC